MLFQLTICAAMQDNQAVLRKHAASRCRQTNADGESAGRWRSEQCLVLCSDEEEGTARRIPFLRRKTRCRMHNAARPQPECAGVFSLVFLFVYFESGPSWSSWAGSSAWIGYMTWSKALMCRSARASGFCGPGGLGCCSEASKYCRGCDLIPPLDRDFDSDSDATLDS